MSEVKCWKRGEGRKSKNYGYFPKVEGDTARHVDGSVTTITPKGTRHNVTLKLKDGTEKTFTRREYKQLRKDVAGIRRKQLRAAK